MPSNITAEIFSKEIILVCQSLFESGINLEEQPLKASDPNTWIGTPSVRERILIDRFTEQTGTTEREQKDKADLYLVCAASFDIDTNYKNFDVDHFFPKAEILRRLEDLINNEPELLQKTKEKLLEDCESQGISRSLIGKLIHINAASNIDITGLKLVYCNYPKNLAPISRTLNVSKGKKEPIDNLICASLINLYHITQDEDYIKQLIAKDKIQLEHTDIYKCIEEAAEKIRKELGNKFKGNYAIIPHDADKRSILEVFKDTHVGKICENYARETAKNVRQMLLLTRQLALLSISDDLTIQRSAIRGATAFELFRKALLKELGIDASPFKGRISEGTRDFVSNIETTMGVLAASFSQQESFSERFAEATATNVSNQQTPLSLIPFSESSSSPPAKKTKATNEDKEESQKNSPSFGRHSTPPL